MTNLTPGFTITVLPKSHDKVSGNTTDVVRELAYNDRHEVVGVWTVTGRYIPVSRIG